MTIISFRFDRPKNVSPVYLDGVKILFSFTFIDSDYIGTPRQSSETKQGKIYVQASRTLLDTWSLEGESIEKVLFQIAKEHISSALCNDGALPTEIQLVMDSNKYPGPCPFDHVLIEKPAGAIFQMEIKRRMGFI